MKPNLALILAITAALGALPLATEGSWAKGGGGGHGGGGHGGGGHFGGGHGGADTSAVVMAADTTPVVMVGADTSAVAEDEAVTAATPSARREDGISLRERRWRLGRLGRRLGRLGWLGRSSVLAVSLRRHLLIRAMAV
jgi:Predicted membrane protein